MAMEIQLTDDSFDTEVIRRSEPVLVDFWATWCGPCRMLSPVIEELSKEFAGKARIAKINTDEHPNAGTRYRISAIPTLLFFKNGRLVDQMVGVHTKAEIKKTLDALVGSES
jgi:thioredoxin 1